MSDGHSPVNLDQLILRAFYWIDEGLQRNLQARGGPRVTRSQSMIIMCIGEGIQRPSMIAERLGVSRQAVHQCLKELIAVGLVELVVDPRDRRAKIARLSERGKPLRILASRILNDLEEELADRIGAQALRSLRKALEKDWGAPADLG